LITNKYLPNNKVPFSFNNRRNCECLNCGWTFRITNFQLFAQKSKQIHIIKGSKKFLIKRTTKQLPYSIWLFLFARDLIGHFIVRRLLHTRCAKDRRIVEFIFTSSMKLRSSSNFIGLVQLKSLSIIQCTANTVSKFP
jgi:hypothetical protein